MRSLWTYNVLLSRLQISCIQIVKRYAQSAPTNMYITTPIFYVNGTPHIGHLYSAVLADCITRYNYMLGYTTFLSTGTDEHGNKVKTAAETTNLPIPEYCTKISQKFQEMCNTFDVNYSTFVRTTEQRHYDAAYHFWKILEEKNYIYLGKYVGWYCISEEAFLADKDIIESKDSLGRMIRVSVESGNPVVWTEEENYKFRLSMFQDDLKYWIKQDNTVQPKKFHKILSQWIEEGSVLQDLSISRPVSRVPWGIPTPTRKDQCIYVWLDALISYLTSVGYPNTVYKQFWPPYVQVIGKDILKFHGIYWPAFLIAAGLEPPRTLLCHSHWTVDNRKMSKSTGNVISPFDAALNFTNYGLRYFILREAVPHSDANFSQINIQNTLNSELANTLGNLINRSTGKAVNPTGEIPNPVEYMNVLKSDISAITMKNIELLGTNAQQHYENYNLHSLVDAVMAALHNTNQMFDYHKPWLLCKQTNNLDAITELKAVICLTLESVRVAALVLYPIMPKLASNILDLLVIPQSNRTWSDTKSLYQSGHTYKSKIIKQNNMLLFRKIKAI